MKLEEVIEQLRDLRHSQAAFDDKTKDTEVFRKDIEALNYAIKVLEEQEKKNILEKYEEDVYVRHCNECGKEMWEGFCIEGGLEYYCSEECLHKNLTEEEYEELYDNGNGDSYYTEWYDELRIYNKIKESE